ncbi:MAG TPA: HVO_0476 family zinc finger protein [Methanocorpusculum sp.]|nr:HVO_0476 family zinc finger protein [Methanocorpusculum sp.]
MQNIPEDIDMETQDSDYLILRCPVCEMDVDFEVLKEPPQAVVRCTECGHTMHVLLKEPRMFYVKAIISHGSESITAKIELAEGEMISVGDYLVAETEDDTYNVEVLSIESDNARREKLVSDKISTLWTRLVDVVIISASVNKGANTMPLYETVKGDKEFEVGSITTIAGKQFRIKRMKLRNNHMYTRKGRTAKAYEIKRIFGERS